MEVFQVAHNVARVVFGQNILRASKARSNTGSARELRAMRIRNREKFREPSKKIIPPSYC